MDLRTPPIQHRCDSRDARGFSLIELMVVLTILAILVAIAIPSLLAATKPAADRRAQTLLHAALLTGRAVAGDRDTYVGVGASDLAAAEHSLRFVGASTDAASVRNEVSVRTGSLGTVDYLIVSSRSASGTCFALIDRSDEPTSYRLDASAATCRAADMDPTGTWDAAW
jgi:prepilin-type N-terminal cleavage/methylation domain-containing protein